MNAFNRRSLFGLFATTAAGLAVVPQNTEAKPAAPAPIPKSSPTEQQFMVGNYGLAVDWRGPWGVAGQWWMSEKEGASWFDLGPLNEEGRAVLLKHFHLQALSEKLPVEVIQAMSPSQLVQVRRWLEKEHNFEYVEIERSRHTSVTVLPENCA